MSYRALRPLVPIVLAIAASCGDSGSSPDDGGSDNSHGGSAGNNASGTAGTNDGAGTAGMEQAAGAGGRDTSTGTSGSSGAAGTAGAAGSSGAGTSEGGQAGATGASEGGEGGVELAGEGGGAGAAGTGGAGDNGEGGFTCTPSCEDNFMCCPAGVQTECVPETQADCLLPDLIVNTDALAAEVRLEWDYFDEEHCAIAEQCVTDSGWRRLLRFTTDTPNIGTADLVLGDPEESASIFEYSSCHGHYHFSDYANYALLEADGSVAAVGHKQSFCITDSYQYITDDPTVSTDGMYSCSNQGLSRGWSDFYSADIDCQWIDISDVPPNTYELRVRLNENQKLHELDYENNEGIIEVQVPPDDSDSDPTEACAADETPISQNCGWIVAGSTRACIPDEELLIDCSNEADNTMFRICEGSEPCAAPDSVGLIQDEEEREACATNEGLDCELRSFSCPVSGEYIVLTATPDGDEPQCDVNISEP